MNHKWVERLWRQEGLKDFGLGKTHVKFKGACDYTGILFASLPFIFM
jgi:hypothetical protein